MQSNHTFTKTFKAAKQGRQEGASKGIKTSSKGKTWQRGTDKRNYSL